MPAKPSYCHRLAPAISKLKESSASYLGRRDVEELLDVSKTIAWRICRQCQAQTGPGGVLLFERQQLIQRLEELAAEGGTVAREVARRGRLDEQLLAMRSYLRSRQTKLVPDRQAPAVVNSRFQDLPAHVTFTRTSLQIDFTGVDEFLAGIGAVVYALENDFEAVREFLEDI